jgi:hypothetical protein
VLPCPFSLFCLVLAALHSPTFPYFVWWVLHCPFPYFVWCLLPCTAQPFPLFFLVGASLRISLFCLVLAALHSPTFPSIFLVGASLPISLFCLVLAAGTAQPFFGALLLLCLVFATSFLSCADELERRKNSKLKDTRMSTS